MASWIASWRRPETSKPATRPMQPAEKLDLIAFDMLCDPMQGEMTSVMQRHHGGRATMQWIAKHANPRGWRKNAAALRHSSSMIRIGITFLLLPRPAAFFQPARPRLVSQQAA